MWAEYFEDRGCKRRFVAPLVSQSCSSSQVQFQNLHKDYFVLAGRKSTKSSTTFMMSPNTQTLGAGRPMYYFI